MKKYKVLKMVEEGCGYWCLLSMSCVAILIFVAASIAFLVFGIMFLVNDFDLAHSCPNSQLWTYVLTSMIMSYIGNCVDTKKNEDTGRTIRHMLCNAASIGLIELTLSIWGGMEIYNNTCNSLAQTNLWIYAQVIFCLQMLCAFTCLLSSLVGGTVQKVTPIGIK